METFSSNTRQTWVCRLAFVADMLARILAFVSSLLTASMINFLTSIKVYSISTQIYNNCEDFECYLFLTYAIVGSYPHPKGCELATAYLLNAFPVGFIEEPVGECDDGVP